MELNLSNTAISLDGLFTLAKDCRAISALTCDNTKLGPGSADALSHFMRLHKLRICNTGTTNEDIVRIVNALPLTALAIGEPTLTDAVLRSLADSQSLRTITIVAGSFHLNTIADAIRHTRSRARWNICIDAVITRHGEGVSISFLDQQILLPFEHSSYEANEEFRIWLIGEGAGETRFQIEGHTVSLRHSASGSEIWADDERLFVFAP
jgi:hypothetical protein